MVLVKHIIIKININSAQLDLLICMHMQFPNIAYNPLSSDNSLIIENDL